MPQTKLAIAEATEREATHHRGWMADILKTRAALARAQAEQAIAYARHEAAQASEHAAESVRTHPLQALISSLVIGLGIGAWARPRHRSRP